MRDILHVDDLYDLLVRQLERIDECSGKIYNVGGGRSISISLLELTQMCHQETGVEIPLGEDSETREADIPYFVTDMSRIMQDVGWQPRKSVEEIVSDIHKWIIDNKTALTPIFCS